MIQVNKKSLRKMSVKMTYNNSRSKETIDSEDTFSETSQTSELNKFEKDSFIVF